MPIEIKVVSQAEFDAWVKAQTAPPAEAAPVATPVSAPAAVPASVPAAAPAAPAV